MDHHHQHNHTWRRKSTHLQLQFPIRMIIAVITLVIVLTDYQINAQQLDIQPKEITLVEGNSTSLLCRYSKPLQYCRMSIPGVPILNLSPDSDSKGTGYSYYGKGLQSGECGVTIDKVVSRNHGQVNCFLGVVREGTEKEGTINLTVAWAPNEPELDILTPPLGNRAYGVDQLFNAKCISRDGRPAANLSWFIDDEPIYEGLHMPEIVESLYNQNTTLYTTTQEIQKYLAASDDGKYLICRSSHLADPNGYQERKYLLWVKYQPQPLPDILVYGLTIGTTAIINITIRANPRPHIEWIIDGIVIPQGTQNDRYAAYEPKELGSGLYNITFSIAGLTLDDTMKDYSLRATNEFGPQDYVVRISSSDTPLTTGLSVGAIIGIVIIIILIVMIILIVAFARSTGRWCFAGDSINTDIGPDSEAQIHPHHEDNDNYDGGKDFDGVQHIDTRQQNFGDETTPPVTDKLESQIKNDLKKSSANGHPNGKDIKSNTPV